MPWVLIEVDDRTKEQHKRLVKLLHAKPRREYIKEWYARRVCQEVRRLEGRT